jgi:ArsR family transcriptional regulator
MDDATLKGLVDVFHMLADSSRLRILLALARAGEMHVSALCQLLGQSQPAVSHHLSLLLSRKLVSCRRDGKNRCYCVDLCQVRELLHQFFGDTSDGQHQLQLDGFSLAFKSW